MEPIDMQSRYPGKKDRLTREEGLTSALRGGKA
jgi:hypothetical protein